MNTTKQNGIPLIIDSPELQARHKRVVYSAATLMAWSIWLYLWLPLVSLLAWWFGIRRFMREFVVPETGTILLTLAAYGTVVLALALIIIAWSQYNLRRFGPRGLRKATPEVSDADMATWFGIPEAELPGIRRAESQVVRFLSGGRIELEEKPVWR